MYVSEEAARRAEITFRAHGGILRTSQAARVGIHPRTLYWLRDEGRLNQVTYGVYRLADLPSLSNPDLVTVAARFPGAVVCLFSALAFHGITTEIPHEVHLALTRTMRRPALDHPPLRIYRFSGEAFTSGIETHDLDGVLVRIYSPAKTVADCLKFRNTIGLDVAIEALRIGLVHRRTHPDDLLKQARVCRVESLMRVYLEALT